MPPQDCTLPKDLDGWKFTLIRKTRPMLGRASRGGIVFVVEGSPEGGWTVSKMRGGQVLATEPLYALPPVWADKLGIE